MMKQILEIRTEIELEDWLREPVHRVAVHGIDLTGKENALAQVELSGCLFLACKMSDALAGYLVSHQATVIPESTHYEFPVHRPDLYRCDELFSGFDPNAGEFGNYSDCFDQLVYQEYLKHGKHLATVDVTLARSLHDHSMTDARDEFVDGKKIVAIMGGHDLKRADPDYIRVAKLSRQLRRQGYTMASGGGPGAMEATHLGAYFAPLDDAAMDEALARLAIRRGVQVESKEYKDRDWLQRAYRIREAYPLSLEDESLAESLAIPTWFYGHEPPAPFASHIAKYFANSIREDGLLQIADHGIIFAPGNAGTVQEIFQDAAQNYYRTFGHAAPMILLGAEYWTKNRPAWDLLRALADTPGKSHMKPLVNLCDDSDEAARLILEFSPPQST